MKLFNKYTENSGEQFNFPSIKDASVKQGDSDECKKYYLSMAEAILASHVRDRCGIEYSFREEIDQRRLFSQGAQSEDRYKNFFFPSENVPQVAAIDQDGVDTGRGTLDTVRADVRQGWMNVFWDIVSPAQKFTERLVGLFAKTGYRVNVDGIDEYTGAIEEKKKYELLAIKDSLEFSKTYFKRMGLEYDEPEFIPENEDELETWKDRGGFKPDYAMRMEEIIDFFFKQSSWDEVKKKMFRDAIDVGVMACMDYYCYDTNTYKTRYLDPKYVIIQASEHNDYHDAEFQGYIEDMTASELRGFGVEEEDIVKAVKQYEGYEGNPAIDDGEINTKVNDMGAYSYDFSKVSVLHGYFIDSNEEQKLVKKNRYGGRRVIDQQPGIENPPDSKHETVNAKVDMAYQFSWIIGTSTIFNHGPVYDQVRPKLHITTLPIRVYRLDGESITKRLIPIYDQFQVLWLKLMNGISMAINAGYAIDYDAISNMSMDGAKSPQEAIVRRFMETGILFFRKHSINGDPNSSSGIPIHNLTGSLSNVFTEFARGFNINAQLAEQITGFSPMAVGGTPDAETPVKTSEMALSATHDSLRPIITGFLELKEQLASRAITAIQMKIQTSKDCRKAYSEIIGNAGVRAIRAAQKHHVEYGFVMEARPSDLELREILEHAKIARIGSKEGAPPIKAGDYFRVIRVLMSTGNIRLAEMILDSSERRAKKEADKMAKENLAISQQSAIETTKATQQAEMEKIRLDTRAKIAVEREKSRLKKEELMLEAKLAAEKGAASKESGD